MKDEPTPTTERIEVVSMIGYGSTDGTCWSQTTVYEVDTTVFYGPRHLYVFPANPSPE